MNFQDKIALEILAKSLLEYKYRNYQDGSNWESAGRTTRNRYRQKAEELLEEGYYNDR